MKEYFFLLLSRMSAAVMVSGSWAIVGPQAPVWFIFITPFYSSDSWLASLCATLILAIMGGTAAAYCSSYCQASQESLLPWCKSATLVSVMDWP